MSAHASRERNGARAAMIGLLAVGLLFFVIVGYGWSRIFANMGAFVSLALGTVAAFTALALAFTVANAKVEAGRWTPPAVLVFILLFSMSAMGSLNSLFTAFLSEAVIKSELNRAYEHVIQLRDQAKVKMATPDSVKFRADALGKWEALKQEIQNPARCGQGPVAAARLTDLQTVLPNFRLLAGLSCATASATLPIYERTVNDLIEKAPVVMEAKPIDRKREDIVRGADEVVKLIGSAQAHAGQAFALTDIKNDVSGANTKFVILRNEAESAVPGGFPAVPRQLDTFQIDALGNIGQVLPFMMSRLGDASTYIFFAVALILDFAIVAMFAGVIGRSPSGQRVRLASQPEAL